jgi:hypothetical protein
MASTTPKPIGIGEIKSKLLRPALTSHFLCEFYVPSGISSPSTNDKSWIQNKRISLGLQGSIYDNEFINLSCCDASLPGSTFYTHEVVDYHGVTERLPYRRVYDDRADFTFYVDHNYEIITFFEIWMQYIANEQYTEEYSGQKLKHSQYSYRMNYPDGIKSDNNTSRGYRSDIYITKFDRDFGKIIGDTTEDATKKSASIKYRYIDAYPISIMSMPVSYESSELLKCTVSFTYNRYLILGAKTEGISNPNPQNSVPKLGPAFGTDQEFFDELNRR